MADSRASDDGFHEIQLNGKQLVFLFMAATVVSVVIFLCGVLVGRGVRATRGAVAQAAALAEAPAPDVMNAPAAMPAASPETSSGADPTAAPPPPALDDLSYSNRLEQAGTPKDDLKPAPRPDPAPAVPEAPPAAAGAVPPPSGSGYAVQVAAVNVRGEADSIARRLSAKGYTAYVEAPARGSGSVFRVRIGTFKTRREADVVAARLQAEEQIKPWVTR